MKDKLIPSLPESPPDIEALRLYIMLPECEILHKEANYQSIDIPFGEAILQRPRKSSVSMTVDLFLMSFTSYHITCRVIQHFMSVNAPISSGSIRSCPSVQHPLITCPLLCNIKGLAITVFILYV